MNDEQTHTMESALRASYADGMAAAAKAVRARLHALDYATYAKSQFRELADELEAEAKRMRGAL